MRPKLLLLLLLALPLEAQEAFFFDPLSGSPAGGDVIRFTINDPSIDLRSGTPEIFFGGIPSPNVTVIDSGTLTAVTPPHGEAPVTVGLRFKGMEYGSERDFGYVRPRDPLLIPVAIETAGAFGTLWTTDIFVYNDSDENVNLMQEVCFFIGAVFPCSNPLIVAPHASRKIPPRGFPEMYVFPPNDLRDKLHFSIRARDTSRADVGTQIPLVPVSQYREGKVVLVNVPIDDRFRNVLRVYDQERMGGNPIVVRVFDSATGTLLTQRDTGFRPTPTDNPLRFSVSFFDLLSDPAVAGHGNVRIEIEEQDASLWAMLTLTENSTQRITLLTSQ